MIVDVHAHFFPPGYFRHIGVPLTVPPSAALGHQSMGERLELLDRTGVDVQVLSIGYAQPYLETAARAGKAARLLNDELVEVSGAYPGRFRVLASLPLPHVEASLEEIDRVTTMRDVVGFTLGCSVGARPLDDERFSPVFDALAKRGSCVLLHPTRRSPGPAQDDYNLTWLIGAPMEDTEAALRLVLSGTLERHRGLKIIVPHLGGSIPFLLARLARVSRHPTMAADLRALYFDTVSGSGAALRCACETIGSDRLVFGTDYPYCDAAEFGAHLDFLSEAHLADTEVRAIAGNRAADLMGLTAGRC